MTRSPECEAPKTASRVLIVEDDAFIGMLYKEVLAEMGHSVCAIEMTETRAIAAAAQFKPDLMIVDATLREGSGVGAVQGILSDGFVPHLFVSGDIAAVKALMPAAIVVQKPFLERDLARAIQRALCVRPTP